MGVSTIALYASPPTSVVMCSSAHPSSCEFDVVASSTTSRPSATPCCCCCLKSSLFSFTSYSAIIYHNHLSLYHHQYMTMRSSLSYSSSSNSYVRFWDKSGNSNHRLRFNGFVTNAFGSSCIHYGSPSSIMKEKKKKKKKKELRSSPHVDDPSSSSHADDPSFLHGHLETYAKDLLTDAQSRHNIFFHQLVLHAFFIAEKAHRGQMRASGDPYLLHCVETAMLLASVGASSSVVAAGLLHDTLDDSFLNCDYISTTFGAAVADLVQGVSKLSQLSELARQNGTANKSDEADRLHTMFLAMADARAVLIKVADRLHNMKTLEALPLVKRQRFAKETLEVFAPLANRLGIYRWKEQLEDLCFKHLNVEQHEALSSKLVDSFDEAVITSAVVKLQKTLKEKAISYHCISGRHKSLYSIYRKMLKKKQTVDEIHDIHGLRLIVDNEEDCYKALEVVYLLWPQVPGKFKDYITRPKFNGYQSLHTVVIDEGMVPLEVQIRTRDMHMQAEFGFAAHWRYKEGDSKHSSFVLQMVEWARSVIAWQCEAMNNVHQLTGLSDFLKSPCTFPTHADDFPYSYKPHCSVNGPVFIVLIESNKMSVQELPANSSIMDLLERVGRGTSSWIPYGYPAKEEFRAKLNHKPVRDPSCKFKMGDVVELSPSLPEKSLTEYREEIQRMYDNGLTNSKYKVLT